MKRNRISVIAVNPGCGDYRPAKIASDIFGNDFGITKIGFGIDIEAVFMLSVAVGLYPLKEGPILSSISLRSAVRKALRR